MAKHKKLHRKTPILKKLLNKSFGEIYFKSLSPKDLNVLTNNFQIGSMSARGNQIVVKIMGSN